MKAKVIIKTPFMEQFDLLLTQDIENYSEMDIEAAKKAIDAEWPQQMASLLKEFLFVKAGGQFIETRRLLPKTRKDGHCAYFVAIGLNERGHL